MFFFADGRLLYDWGFYTMTVKRIQSRPLSLYLPARSMFASERTAPVKRTTVPTYREKKSSEVLKHCMNGYPALLFVHALWCYRRSDPQKQVECASQAGLGPCCGGQHAMKWMSNVMSVGYTSPPVHTNRGDAD